MAAAGPAPEGCRLGPNGGDRRRDSRYEKVYDTSVPQPGSTPNLADGGVASGNTHLRPRGRDKHPVIPKGGRGRKPPKQTSRPHLPYKNQTTPIQPMMPIVTV